MTKEMPWAKWPVNEFHSLCLQNVLIGTEGKNIIVDGGVDEDNFLMTSNAICDLGGIVGFPGAFVSDKVHSELAADIISHRLFASASEKEVLFVMEGRKCVSVIPSVRSLLTYQETAQTAYDVMLKAYGEDNFTVEVACVFPGSMTLRMLTSVEAPITRQVGDILALGVDIRQDYNDTTEVGMFTRRLSCLNGMVGTRNGFSWLSKAEGSAQHQKMWLSESIAESLGAFEHVVEKAQQMSEVRINGDAEKALLERASAMGLGKRHHAALLAAFRAEPGSTEWHFLNAFTRLATHGGLPGDLGDRVQVAAGEWVTNFDLCTARLPVSLATRVGATILKD